MTGSNSKGVNLEAICLEFLGTHHSSNEELKPLNKMMESLERNLGGNIILFKDGEVRYGASYIEDMDDSSETDVEEVEEI